MSSKKYLVIAAIIFSGTAFCQPCTTPPTINFNQATFELCPGESVTVEANLIGEVGSVSYSWSPLTGNTDTLVISPTAPVTWYYLEIMDDCFTVVDSVKAELHPVDITSINVTDATNCPGQPGILGSIQILPSNPTYSYSLIGGGNSYGPQVSNTFTNLPGGIIYFVTAENGVCSEDTIVTIGLGANAVTATFNPIALQDVTCGGDQNGMAEVLNVGGGILSPYDITWTHSTGLFDQTVVNTSGGHFINNLFGGDWVVTATDQQGCAWSTLFNIFEPEELTFDFNASNPTCYLFSDGSFNIIPSGGNGGNIYTITNASGTQINSLNGITVNSLVEGWYYANIYDSNGCSVDDSVYIDAPSELDIDMSLTDALCFGGNDGLAIVDTVYNYNGDYNMISYFWNPNPLGLNGIGQNTCSQLESVNYAVTVNDEYGCSRTFDFTIDSPDELYFDIIGSEASSGGTDGIVYASALGGTPGYTYTWTNLSTFATSNNTTWGGLLPGDYEIVVVDANGCTLTAIVSIGYLGAEENYSDDFQIYPSVSSDGFINVNNQIESTVLMTIYNLQGEIVLETTLEQGKKSLTLNLESGTYFYQVVEVQKQTEKISHGKIVIVN